MDRTLNGYTDKAGQVHERVDDVQIDTACGYFIKVTRDITRIKVNHCKNIAKYVSTLDLTEECTGDVDKTYRGDCHYHDSRANRTQHRRSCRIAHHNIAKLLLCMQVDFIALLSLGNARL